MKKANVFVSLSALLAVLLAFIGFGALEHPPPQEATADSQQTPLVAFSFENPFTVGFNGLCDVLDDYGGKTPFYWQNAAYVLGRQPDNGKNASPLTALCENCQNFSGQRTARRPRDGL